MTRAESIRVGADDRRRRTRSQPVWPGWAAAAGVLLVGFGLMLYGERLVARAAGLPTGGRLLARACLWGDAPAARRALAAGAAADATTEAGFPALLVAAQSGDANIVRALLARGADPNVRTTRGWTPLDLAAMLGDVEMIAALLAAGADPNAGRGPLALATAAGHERAIAALLQAGAETRAAAAADLR